MTKEPLVFHIKPLSLADVQSVLQVYQQCEDFLALGPQATATPGMVITDMMTSQHIGGIYCGILGKEDEFMGVLDYLPAGHNGSPRQAYLALLMIAAPYRQRGLGARVLAWLEEQLCQNAEIEMLLAHVQVNNPRGQKFWQTQGFAITGAPQLQPDGTTSMELQKKIRNVNTG
jgi:ribosomal protein S18 acetylase RimI-like enzyme